ncbi:MAG: DNA replication/repair protein RecF [Alphaproteobacteria bacterium]
MASENASAGVIRINLHNFRNYAALEADFPASPIVLFGENGAGKTNILEALSFLSPGRGLRNARLSHVTTLPQKPGATWAASVQVALTEGSITLGTGLEFTGTGQERRAVKIEGVKAARQATLAEWISVIWITPQMGRLFIDPASGRRKFVDRLVFSLNPMHAEHIQRYEHALTERSSLLKKPPYDPSWVEQLETQIAEKAVAIAGSRKAALQQVSDHQSDSLVFPRFFAHMEGEFEQWFEQEGSQVEERLRQTLHNNRRLDAEIGGSRIGPHRSDLNLTHCSRNMIAAQCSTGEQKMLLLAITLAFVRVQRHNQDHAWRRTNLLLIDDVVAHLDAHHRSVLFDEVCHLNLQTWLTGTDLDVFQELKDRAQLIRVDNATLNL